MHEAGLKLCLALMLGLLIVPGYVVAPMLFSQLESAQAGFLAGKLFHIANPAILILSLAALMFSSKLNVPKANWRLLIAVIVLVAANEFGASTMIAMIKAEAGDISLLADDAPMRLMFKFWHGMGSILHLISSIVLVMLVMKSSKHIESAKIAGQEEQHA